MRREMRKAREKGNAVASKMDLNAKSSPVVGRLVGRWGVVSSCLSAPRGNPARSGATAPNRKQNVAALLRIAWPYPVATARGEPPFHVRPHFCPACDKGGMGWLGSDGIMENAVP